MLRENAVDYLVLGDGDDNIEEFDAILELTGDGGWHWKRVNTGQIPD